VNGHTESHTEYEDIKSFSGSVIELFRKLHPLDRVPRAGFLLRGVCEPESVAAHSHFLALLVMLTTDQHPETYDRYRAVAMALMHDLSEAVTMDIPMPAGDRYFREAKTDAEQGVIESLFEEFPAAYAELHRELIEGKTAEARLVRAMDKAQMMIKVLCYQAEGRGNLEEFWRNERNFEDYGIPEAASLFREIRRRAGEEPDRRG
jgi:putative hydrolase of HD superfamily